MNYVADDVDAVESNLANYITGDISGSNPPNLDVTALINRAALCTLMTKQAPAAAMTNANIQIIIIQPGGDHMMTTHAVDLLLRNLPPEARLGYHLPGLVNNLLSIAALVHRGCKGFFHRTGCKVMFNRAIILQGWRDPQNRLWQVKIVNGRWTTVYKVAIPLQEAPTITLTMPPTTHAYSLYVCSTTHKLTHFYFTCLNYPAVSTLIKAIKAGYL